MFLHSSPLTGQIIENIIPTWEQFLLLEMLKKKGNVKKHRCHQSFAVSSRFSGSAACAQFKWRNISVLVKKTWPVVHGIFWQAVGLYKCLTSKKLKSSIDVEHNIQSSLITQKPQVSVLLCTSSDLSLQLSKTPQNNRSILFKRRARDV